MLNWSEIHTVLLDMDGTLLDLHYDNYFWREHLPRRYAEKHRLPIDAAKSDLLSHYQRKEGSLDWYCVDYWSRTLGMDIAQLKTEVQHLIAVQPQVADFLDYLRYLGKTVCLVTNAHPKSLRLKLDKTALGKHFDRIICAHSVGMPKEQPGFWDQVQAIQPFDKDHCVLIDDSLPVLRAAQRYGMRYLVAITQPDSRQPATPVAEFAAIHRFVEIMPNHPLAR
ncbi:MAG: GMP/IMP nucleotidase [Gammaproteobacteria bacterium]|nr:GMP/IMP nucleotidase [Gammaproteobacteria bacterium]